MGLIQSSLLMYDPPPHSMFQSHWLIAPSSSTTMAGHKVAHATLQGPSVTKEICIGIVLGFLAGGVWKKHHWNEKRKIRGFYEALEKGEISVIAEEQ
ncbi:hypothetical protein RJ641_023745 [Dillenia turbinata]|uniref:Cytochrome c oxidase subunit 5C n=1 Tax=Dillenia turbinata TaxID=194707 RepID=A0AAN8UJK8_9MAGN